MIRHFSTAQRALFSSRTAILAKAGKDPLTGVSKSRFAKALPLEEFLFRQRVKSIYRDLIRIVYRNHEKMDLMHYIRAEFKINEAETDLNHRRYLLNLGLKKINEMIYMMGIRSPEFK